MFFSWPTINLRTPGAKQRTSALWAKRAESYDVSTSRVITENEDAAYVFSTGALASYLIP